MHEEKLIAPRGERFELFLEKSERTQEAIEVPAWLRAGDWLATGEKFRPPNRQSAPEIVVPAVVFIP